MTVDLSRPVSAEEAHDHRASGHWADDVPVCLETLRAHAERTALVDRRGAITYAELSSAVERVASALDDAGVARGDAVVVVTDNDRASVAATHAVWHLGAVAVLVHTSSGAADLEVACRAVSPTVVLLAPAAEGLLAAATIDGPAVLAIVDLPSRDVVCPSPAPVDADAARLVIFTSGTTSTPKGVVHTANTLRASAANFRALMDFRPDERIFCVSPLASIAGVLQALELAPELGATVILENAWDEDHTLDLLLATGGTYYGGTDNALARLFAGARRRGVGLPLRAVSVGGTMLRADVLLDAEENFDIRVLRVYGSSEAPNSTGSRPGEGLDVRLGDDGWPAPGVELRLAEDGSDEVQLRGPHVFRGYVDPADSVGAFDDDWFRTGDTGVLHDRRLRIVGRLKEIAIRNGRKVSLAEVEDAFRSVSPVTGCAAFAVPDEVTGERVAVAVEMPDDAALDVPAVLDAMVSSGIAKWKLPESVQRHPSALPMTATGKVRRNELSEDLDAVIWRAPRLATTAR
ncbi:MAG: class I adenylate-forming enzyme family protein [Acidimicrobiia bacterium]